VPCEADSRLHFKDGHRGGGRGDSLYWLEVLVEGRFVAQKAVDRLLDEGDQLLRMAVASINTARGDSR